MTRFWRVFPTTRLSVSLHERHGLKKNATQTQSTPVFPGQESMGFATATTAITRRVPNLGRLVKKKVNF